MRCALLLIGLLVVVDARAQLAPNAPADQPQALQQQQIDAFEAAIKPYVDEARKTYPEARQRFVDNKLPPGHVFYVTVRLRDSAGHFEQAFVRVQEVQDQKVTGVIANDIQLVEGYELGQVHSFDDSELIDWLIAHPDGSEEGNVVGKFLDTYRP
jgi:Uncharacterized protein conserved in bacteria (DUF2314)